MSTRKRKGGDNPAGLLPDEAGIPGREWLVLTIDEIVAVAVHHGRLRRGVITREEWNAKIEAIRARLWVERGV